MEDIEKLEIVKYTKEAFIKWNDFNGVANRPQYWWYVLALFIVNVVLGLFSDKLQLLLALVTIVPSIAIGIRRMRDIGQSGWWLLINLIPFIGWIVFIILAAQPTKKEA